MLTFGSSWEPDLLTITFDTAQDFDLIQTDNGVKTKQSRVLDLTIPNY